MRIVMMGTGPFAVPTFKHLYRRGDEILAVVVRPEKGQPHAPSALAPMRRAAQELALEVLDPPDVNAPEFVETIRQLGPELLMVCDFGQILSADLLAAVPLGGINLHGSLLPKYRGAAPIAWALYHGETRTGVSVIHMTPRLDAGPILVSREVAIDPAEDAEALEARLAELGAEASAEAIDLLARWDRRSPIGKPQDPKLASRAPRLTKRDGMIDWNRSARQIFNQIRAMKPWPGTYTHWLRAGKAPLRLIIDWATPINVPPNSAGRSIGAIPGTVLFASAQNRTEIPVAGTGESGWREVLGGPGLVVATGEGVLSIERIQPAGKRVLDIAAFLRGYPICPDERLGNP